MKKLLFLVLCFCYGYFQAAYSINGFVPNSPNTEVFIYKYLDNMEFLAGKMALDSKGNFEFIAKDDYQGLIRVFIPKKKASTLFFVDNNDIQFRGEALVNNFRVTAVSDKANELYYEKVQQSKNNDKIQLLNQLKFEYNQTDAFYKQINDEISRLNKKPSLDFSSFPFVKYYVEIEENILNKEVSNIKQANKVADEIRRHFVNDNEFLEKSYLMNNMTNLYLTYRLSAYDMPEQQVGAIRPCIDSLLEAVQLDTSRGQNVLVSCIKILRSYQLDFIAEDYVKKGEALTCTINEDLKKTISSSNASKVGGVFPDFTFSKNKENTKAKSLYDLKADKKLVIFWGSFCSHCREEKPLLEAFYPEFKSMGGEIISFGIETNPDEYGKFIEGVPWVSDTDYLFWTSPVVEQYGIDGTPTMFLLDKDNTIIAKEAKLSLIQAKVNSQ